MSIKESIRNFLRTDAVFAASLPRELTDEYPLIEAGILDSIGTYTLILFLEKNFNVKVELSDLDEKNFANLNQIEAFLKRKTS